MDLKDIPDKEFSAESYRRKQAADAAYQQKLAQQYRERAAQYHQEDLEKAAEIGITVEQLEDAMCYAAEVADDRW